MAVFTICSIISVCARFSICARFAICSILTMIYSYRATLIEIDCISDDYSSFDDLVNRGHIVIVLQCIDNCLKSRDICIDLIDKSLQVFESLPCRNLHLSAVAEYEQHIVRIAGIHILEHGITIHSILSVFAVLSVLTVFAILSVLTGSLSKLLP